MRRSKGTIAILLLFAVMLRLFRVLQSDLALVLIAAVEDMFTYISDCRRGLD
jgi:hypothetical protein